MVLAHCNECPDDVTILKVKVQAHMKLIYPDVRLLTELIFWYHLHTYLQNVKILITINKLSF